MVCGEYRMNQTLKHVSQHFDLGTPTQAPTRVNIDLQTPRKDDLLLHRENPQKL